MADKREACTKAIAAHASWKTKFKSFLSGELELDAAQVEKSDACDFGKWLKDRPPLEAAFHAQISSAHAHFHKVAGEVVRATKAGNRAKATTSLAVGGDFSKATTALTTLVVKARDS